ncbi:MAG: hypothetical protein HYZ53_12060 [Planctomycetes bacterium]|nr:hypothetical protein [Planctomycetota bacterium]
MRRTGRDTKLDASAKAAGNLPAAVSRRGGYSLIAVTGMLGLLSTTAVTYVTISAQERAAAQNHVLTVRARMLAEAGVERAVSDLRNVSAQTDALGSSPLQRRQAWADPRDEWFFGEAQAAPAGPRLYGAPPTPLERARRVSFAAPASLPFGISGTLGGSVAADSDTYTLKVLDCASQLNVNDANASLLQILDHLGELVGAGRVNGLSLGAAIVGARPRDGYATKEEVLSLAFHGDAAQFARVRDFITCHGWTDPGTVRWSQVAPRWRLEPRSPIDVNTAPKEVLVAVLWGLAAQLPATGATPARKVGPIGRAKAEFLAEQLIARRPAAPDQSPFTDWVRFSREVLGRLRGVSRAEKDLLRANFDPNTNLKKLNPDRLVAEPDPEAGPGEPTRLDKSDLTFATTEFCFGSMGYYEIESLGRVLKGGKALAQATVRTVAKVFDVERVSGQRELERERVWSDRRFGDLRGPDGIPSVTSFPEYPFATGRMGYKGAKGEVDWAAAYDGGLVLSGVSRAVVVDRPEGATFVAGFGRGRVEADLGRGTDLPAPPTPAAAVLDPGSEARVGESQVVQARSGAAAFSEGSDLEPFGLRLDGRGRAKAYPAGAWPTGAGTVEFLVKPSVDLRLGAVASRGRRIPFVTWSNGGSFSFVRFDLYALGGRLFAEWSVAGDGRPFPTETIRLFADLDWLAHTWHHVEVGWNADGTWLFVDGQLAPGAPAKAPAVFQCPPDQLVTPPWFLVGAGVELSWDAEAAPEPALGGVDAGAALDGGRERLVRRRQVSAGGNATIDNLCVHPSLRHTTSFLPPSRYQDPSYRAYTAVGQGPSGRRRPVGVYKRRLRSVERAAATGEVMLGTVSCTALVPEHVHAHGHDAAAGAFGHVSPGIELVSGGASSYVTAYDLTAGMPVAKKLGRGAEVSFLAEFEVPDRLPVMESPILCDFTVTWMGRTRYLVWVVGE